jgi:acetyl-CoA carboxylase alpha subunit
MNVRDELFQFQIDMSLGELMKALEKLRNDKQMEIENLKDKITKYEKKKRAEAAFYQSLSPVRKFFASRPPSHHQAVEYIVHVKERLKQIEKLKRRISEIDFVKKQLEEDRGKPEIILQSTLVEELQWRVGK